MQQHSSAIEQGIFWTMNGRIAHDDELGIRYDCAPGYAARVTMPGRLAVSGPDTQVAHGAVATLLDTVCGIGAMASLDFREAVATVDLRIDYLRQLTLALGVEAQAQVSHLSGAPGEGTLVIQASAIPHEGENSAAALCTGRFKRRSLPEQKHKSAGSAAPEARESQSYNELMGFQDGLDGQTVLPFRPELLGNGSLPSLHGGAVAALLQDCACRFIGRNCNRSLPLVTAHFNFLRFGRPADVIALPESVRIGRSTATIRASAHHADDVARPIACATITFAAD